MAKFRSVPTQEFPDRKLEHYKYGKTENKTSQVRKSQRFRNLIRKYYSFLLIFEFQYTGLIHNINLTLASRLKMILWYFCAVYTHA